MKILILKPSSLGDVVQALPVLRMLKRHWPESEIHWWIDRQLAPLLEADPDLAGLIRFDRNGWGAFKNWTAAWRALHRLRAQRFDLVIDLQALLRSGALAWLVDGKQVIGLDDPREGAPAFYDTRVHRSAPAQHAVDWYLAVLGRLGLGLRWDFDWFPSRPLVLDRLRERWPIDGYEWIAIHASARWENKRWPADYFVELVRSLGAQTGPEVRFAVLGGGEDRELSGAISAALPDRCVNLTGRTTLPEMVEWLRCASVLVSNDSGPMHVAAALGTPVVALFGPTDPRRTGPYGQLEHAVRVPLPCAPCLKSYCRYVSPLACLREIQPAAVAPRVLALRTVRTPASAGASARGPGLGRDQVCPLPHPASALNSRL